MQRKAGLGGDVGDRRVGRQPHDGAAADVADVMRADADLADPFAVVEGRPHLDRDSRQAGDRLDAPHDLRRTVGAAVEIEARREIDDAHLPAARIDENCLDDGGVAQVLRLDLDKVGERHFAKPLLFVSRQQAGEHRIGIEARKAPPNDAPAPVDESGGLAIADQREIHACAGLSRDVHEAAG